MDILVIYRKCSAENTVTIAKGDSASPRCLRCDDVLSYTSVSGYIYILSNPRMKDLLKIGLSTRPVQERIAELSSATGVPAPFEPEAYFVSTDPEAHEQEIHAALAEYRVKGKKFFDLPLSKALRMSSNLVVASVSIKRNLAWSFRNWSGSSRNAATPVLTSCTPSSHSKKTPSYSANRSRNLSIVTSIAVSADFPFTNGVRLSTYF